jgi:hypothetical protein
MCEMKFYTNTNYTVNSTSGSSSHFTVQSSGNVGIGTTPPSQKMTIYSNGHVGFANTAPSHQLHIYSKFNEDIEKMFFEISILLSRRTEITSESLRFIYKNLLDLGSEDQELIDGFNSIDKILFELKCPKDVFNKVIDAMIFCATHKLSTFRKIDYLKMFEKIDG